MRKILAGGALAAVVLLAAGTAAYSIPTIHSNLEWRISDLRAKIKYAISPPEKVVFIPQESVSEIVQATLRAMTRSPSPTPAATRTTEPTTDAPTQPPTTTPLPSPTSTPIPAKVQLNGIIHEYQKWNNCGPATLAMALTFWGWKGDQRDTAAVLKPVQADKNVMPYEMQAYVEQNTSLRALVRVGGDLDMLKHLIAAGFPIIVEKGFEVPDEGWMGHYEALMGYDDARSRFLAEDSYSQLNDQTPLAVSYTDMESNWRAFDYVYLVIYPAEREAEVLSILGPQADETASYQAAAEKASNEVPALDGRDQFFAWYNRGTSLVNLQDFAGAAAAYDQAFQLYPSIPENLRPWRMLWYQTGPYFAYFYTGRYYDVINLADTTINALSEPAIEESFVWRARAKAALGDTSGAIDDLRTALKWHTNFAPALQELNALGGNP